MNRIVSAFSGATLGRLLFSSPSAWKVFCTRWASLGRGAIAVCAHYICGHLSPRVMFWVLLPLYSLAAILTPLVAAQKFPQPFDIRYRVITNLASWRDNPDGHHLFGVGIGFMMFFLIPFPGYLCRNLGGSAFLRRAGRIELWIGIVGGFILAIESGAVAGLRNLWGAFRKAHELYAVLAFAGLGLGGLSFGLSAIQTVLRAGRGWKSARVIVPSLCLSLMVIATVLLLILFVRSRIPGSSKEASEMYFLLNFPFWEWMSAASMLLLLIAMSYEACFEHGETCRLRRQHRQ